MKIINNEVIKNLNIDMITYYNWIKEMMINKNNTILPPKISMKMENHKFINVMPSVLLNDNSFGVKVVSRYPERIPSLDSQIMLYDLENGLNIAILDGNIITAYRTGAVAALAVNTLAKENYETIAVTGLGNVMRATLSILFETIKDRKIKVKVMKYKNYAEEIIEKYKKYSNITFEIVNTNKELICDSDVIISTVTVATENFGEDNWYKEGCLVVPVHTLGFQNCDLFFDKVIVDDIGHVKGFKYFNEFKEVHELTDVLLDKSLGRTNNKQRILAYNIGNSIYDIYYAKKIYDLVGNKCPDFNLDAPTEKFWI